MSEAGEARRVVDEALLPHLATVSCPRCHDVVEVDVPAAWAANLLRRDVRHPWVSTAVDLTCPTRWGASEPHVVLEVPDE